MFSVIVGLFSLCMQFWVVALALLGCVALWDWLAWPVSSTRLFVPKSPVVAGRC